MNRICALAVAAGLLAGPLAGAASATTFTATTNADSGPGSLRQAILDANASSGGDDIHFNIPGPGVHTITPTTELPASTGPVAIDGYTQPGAALNTNATGALNSVLLIELDGSALSGGGSGLTITGGGSFVTGLAIHHFPTAQVRITGIGGNTIGGNHIGTNAAGTAVAPSGTSLYGVQIDGSDFNFVGQYSPVSLRNLISGNSSGIAMLTGSESNAVEGNLIGTNRAATAALGNGAGVAIVGDSNFVGNSAAASGRNVISGNQNGVVIQSAGSAAIVNNYIGTTANGRAALPNTNLGVWEFSNHDTVIGGTTAAERNVISGNGHGGVGSIESVRTRVAGNFIGLDSTGATEVANGSYGVSLSEGSDGVVGGSSAGSRNVISGNAGDGVLLTGTGHSVRGNYIGMTAGGLAARPNTGDGVLVRGTFVSVGGFSTGDRNVIAGNGGDGVEVTGAGATTDRVGVVFNRIGLGATGLGIPNGENGVHVTGGATLTSVGSLTVTPGTPGGNIISGNDGSGVLIEGAATTGTIVHGNLIGTNVAGTSAAPNAFDGVTIMDGASAEVGPVGGLGSNVISGNELSGVYVVGAGSKVTMGNDLVGLNAAGMAAIPNDVGVELANGSAGSRVGVPGNARTVISGNRHEGVLIHGATTGNFVQDAYIGTRGSGTAAVPNETGVAIGDGAQLNTVGGAATSVRNVISGNLDAGVAIAGHATDRNVVRGNYIGTAADGSAAVPNDVGIDISGGARANTVGGTLNAPLSLISGNRTAGVRVRGPGTLTNRVRGNYIGLRADGVTARPNGIGVDVADGARQTSVGGSTATAANWIAFNTADGVLVQGDATAGSDVNRNRIFRNGGLGINLRPAGEGPSLPTANDPNDADNGPNALQNFPLITTAAGTAVGGTLNSTASTRFRIDIYRNPIGTTAGTAEAENYVGTTMVTTDAAGNATWSLTMSSAHAGELFAATATNTGTLNTSELSPRVTAT